MHQRLDLGSGSGIGWDLQLVEGLDWAKLWIVGFIGLLLSMGFEVCWSVMRHDIQGGFGVTTCLMILLTFSTGVLQTALDHGG